MSELYNKTNIISEWSEMLLSAEAYFDSYNQERKKFHQCIVLCMNGGEQIFCPIAVDSIDMLNSHACSTVEKLLQNYTCNIIKKVVCVWEDKTVDVPSFAFMKKICDLNKENKRTLILLNTGNDMYRTKQIKDII